MSDVVQPAPAGRSLAGIPIQPRVLVVDDSAAGPERIASGMAGWYDVRSESDGVAGWLALLSDASIRAVVAHLSTPWFDGRYLLERVRGSGIARIRDLPVVLVSGDSNNDSRLPDPAAGATSRIDENGPLVAIVGQIEALIHGITPPSPAHVAVRALKRKASASAHFEAEPLREASANAAGGHPVAAREGTAAARGHAHHTTILLEQRDMARLDSLNKILKQLQSETPGVEATALISEDGLMIASALPQDLDDMRVAGMTATLLNLGTRAATELRRGEVREVIVRGEQGYAVTINAGRGAVLLVLASDNTPLGLIFFDMREAIKAVKTIL